MPRDMQEITATMLGKLSDLPTYISPREAPPADWLIDPKPFAAGVFRAYATDLVLSNGLVSRTFRLAPGSATVGFDNLMTGEALLRAVGPEARLTLDGAEQRVGGLLGQQEFAYLSPRDLEQLSADPDAWVAVDWSWGQIRPRLEWARVRHAVETTWPPKGIELRLEFRSTAEGLTDLRVIVHHEVYDGIPLWCKWISIENLGSEPVQLNELTAEVLALPEAESIVDPVGSLDWSLPNLHIESDYAFGGGDAKSSQRVLNWVVDPRYTTQVNYDLKTPCLFESRIPHGPEIPLEPGIPFESHRTWILVHDSTEKERRRLAQRRMYRTIAPWVTENPLMMHVVSSDEAVIRRAIDQCADVGFEMIILSFGSGIDLEDMSPENLARLTRLWDYARERGLDLGGYSLLASRSIDEQSDVVSGEEPFEHFPRFGHSPCLGSPWGQRYFENLKRMFEETGLSVFENDGSYPGDYCSSTAHPGHEGLLDSQWRMWRAITDFYKWCRGRGIYLNVPDWYMLNGSNKVGMGYREVNFSLPRERQVILSRQNMYDGTWQKPPSMGWMFVPLTQYHGGGAAATIEPLVEHLDVYEMHLAQTLGYGVQACWRGPRLYDAPDTRALLKRYVDWFKANREILESDIVQVRRPDGRNIDCVLHVNPKLGRKAFGLAFNPTDETLETTLRIPLYYTGLRDRVTIREREGSPVTYPLDREYCVEVTVEIGARGWTWFVIE